MHVKKSFFLGVKGPWKSEKSLNCMATAYLTPFQKSFFFAKLSFLLKKESGNPPSLLLSSRRREREGESRFQAKPQKNLN